MGAGANIGGFGAGFGKGLANALLSNRDRADQKKRDEQQRQDRLFQAMLPTLIDNVENVADLEPFLAQHLPEQFGGKSGKKGGSPFDNIKRFLGPLVGARQKRQSESAELPQSIQPPGVTGGTLNALPQPIGQPTGDQALGQPQPPQAMFPPAIDMPQGQDPFGMQPGDHLTRPNFKPATGNGLPDLATAGRAAVGQAAQATQPVNRRTLLGVPILSPAEKFERTEQQAEMQIAARRRLAERLGLPPEAATAYALTGQLISPKPGEGFTLGADQVRYDSSGKEIARGPAKPASAADIPNTIDEAIVAADRAGNRAEVERLLKLKAESSAAGREPKAGGTDNGIDALATMVAENPTLPKTEKMTPTQTGQVMAAIARNPVLKAKWETARMVPVRKHAQTMIDALDKLLVTKTDESGKKTLVLGSNGQPLLTPAAQTIIGERTPAMLRSTAAFLARGGAPDALAALNQITSQQTIDMLANMKSQSPSGSTGWGAMNLRELDVTEGAATQLRSPLSHETAAQKLGELWTNWNKTLLPGPGETPPGAGAGANPNPTAPIAGPEWKGGKLYVNGQPIG